MSEKAADAESFGNPTSLCRHQHQTRVIFMQMMYPTAFWLSKRSRLQSDGWTGPPETWTQAWRWNWQEARWRMAKTKLGRHSSIDAPVKTDTHPLTRTHFPPHAVLAASTWAGRREGRGNGTRIRMDEQRVPPPGSPAPFLLWKLSISIDSEWSFLTLSQSRFLFLFFSGQMHLSDMLL